MLSMPSNAVAPDQLRERILTVLREYWGYEALRPLQDDAIHAGFTQRDSLVVLPTGGGKSLCYQIPPLLAERLDVVVSPLISLMKDQVDALRACGYPAAALYSGLPFAAMRDVEQGLRAGRYRLLFVAPERLLTPGGLSLIREAGARSFAIDEAHCISHWGHDFRAEYRRLGELREHFPDTSIHAFTATATERVRSDIIEQLKLREPRVLVGRFDRPNLTYRVVPRVDRCAQIVEILKRHKSEAVIAYCITRRDTEEVCAALRKAGINAAFYHAGMNAEDRRRTHEAFSKEQIDVIVATVAFGMGIDRSDVRCVIHAAMPKSVEHYQQETGRAGRDGLEAECVLLYSAADAIRWESLIQRSAEEADAKPEVAEAGFKLVHGIRRFCVSQYCRHRKLVEYFGQKYEKRDCGACDVCLGEVEGVEDATVTAQKILSCVARVEQRFGITHVIEVLAGAKTERVCRLGHDRLSTWGLLHDVDRKTLRNMIYQLIDQDLLARADGEYPVLVLNDASWEVLRGERSVKLQKPKADVVASRAEAESWEGVDQGLFQTLRSLRREIAEQRGVPPYVVFGDAALRHMACVQPRTLDEFLNVRGVGRQKLKSFGKVFVAKIVERCGPRDERASKPAGASIRKRTPRSKSRPPALSAAFELFAEGMGIDEAAETLQRARSTTIGYLAEYVAEKQPGSLAAWVTDDDYAAVTEAADAIGSRRFKPIFERLDSKIPYDTIRLVLAHRAAQQRRDENASAEEQAAQSRAGSRRPPEQRS